MAKLRLRGFICIFLSIVGGPKGIGRLGIFDPSWYKQENFGVNAALANGQFGWAVEHYLRKDTPSLCDLVAEFSEAYWLHRHFYRAGDHKEIWQSA